jgi:hypothetical protein
VGITDDTSDDDVKQLIDRLREHLEEERYVWIAWSPIYWSIYEGTRIFTICFFSSNTHLDACYFVLVENTKMALVLQTKPKPKQTELQASEKQRSRNRNYRTVHLV